MRKLFVVSVLLLAVAASAANAQETYFGKNKVRYKDFEWNYIQTRHFDLYFYEDAYATSQFAATVLESAYVEISRELTYRIQRRIPVFIYNSHNDFQQTNILPALIGEGTGGFTEVFKNRVVTPFNGSYEDFRHVLHHELTHAVTFDMLYGNAFSSLVSRQRLFQMPLWLAEGYAEYSSRHGWDHASDMWMRDATINGYLVPPAYMTGYNAYREGQALIKYIVDKYGENKLGQLFMKGKVYLSMKKALKKSIGIDEEQLWKDFSKEMKRRYWPEIAKRKEAEEIARKLTDSRKDGSYFNEKPTFNPEGDKLAIFTDRSDFTEIVLISVDDGKIVRRLVRGSRTGDMESLHSYVSGMSFSPDGRQLVFVAKSNGKESLFFYDLNKGKVHKKKRLDYYTLLSPVWSPDGTKIAFSALKANMRDIFVYDLESDQIEQLTVDRYDDVSPGWYPDSKHLVFSSDRPHPQNPEPDTLEHPYVSPGALMPGDFEYGSYNLFKMSVADQDITPLDVGPGANILPSVSPDGSKIAFVSSRNGIDNIYISLTESGEHFAITDILTGVSYLSWSPNGDKLAFEAFYRGAFDVFVLEDLAPVGDDGVLMATAYMRGEYDLPFADATDDEDANEETADSLSEPLLDYEIENDYISFVVDTSGPGLSDSTAVEGSEVTADSLAVGETTDEADSVATGSGIQDGEYVYVSDRTEDPLDPFMRDIPGDSSGRSGLHIREEPSHFDSIPPPTDDGDYEIHKYKVKFTPDYVGGGLGYDTFFGLRGQTVFMFSDYLGNHQIVLATDLVNTIDQSNIQAYYFNSLKRTGFGVGLFHSKNFYLDNNDFLFSDRFYGVQLFASRPFSMFSRLEATLSQSFIDREYYDGPLDTRANRSSKVTLANLGYVTDNILWGITGPINGRRARLAVESGIDLFNSKNIESYSVDLDYRRYWHFGNLYSLAFRASGGMSFGRTPKRYFLGGTTNWIGNRTLDAEVYDVENLYFADVVTPLRGIEYYDLSGDRYGLLNIELRYPMIEYFAMRFPLPLVISRVGGAIFLDIGAAWDGSDFRGGTSEGGRRRMKDIKTGFGFGMRANLGFILLRYDLAWATDFYDVSAKPSYYFSIGADF